MTPADRQTINLSEYDKLKAEQLNRIYFRDNLVYVIFGILGTVLSLIEFKTERTFMFLIIPFISITLGWIYVLNDAKISAINRYFRERLIPALCRGSAGPDAAAPEAAVPANESVFVPPDSLSGPKATAGPGSKSAEPDVLGWEHYHRHIPGTRGLFKFIQWLINELLFVGVGGLSLYLFFQISAEKQLDVRLVQYIVAGTEGVLLFLLFLIFIESADIRKEG